MKVVGVVAVGDNAVIAELEQLQGPVRVVRRCAEIAELLAACQSGLAQVAVIADSRGELTATLVDRLAAVGVSVLALAQEGDASRLRNVGARVLPENVPALQLQDAVVATVEDLRQSGPSGYAVPAMVGTGQGTQDGGHRPAEGAARLRGQEMTDGVSEASELGVESGVDGSPAGRATATRTVRGFSGKVLWKWVAGRHGRAESVAPSGPDAEDPGPHGCKVVAVWGPAGAPGRTTLAVNLAAEFAAAGKSVMLVDADSYGASVAATLGLLDESATFAQACRAADQGSLNVALLENTVVPVVFEGGGFSLLTGLTRAERWPELRAAAVDRVLATAREMVEAVVVDCGFSLENDEELSYDTVAPRRNAATLTVLAQADIIYAVGSGDAIGIPRLVRGLQELQELPELAAARVEVVINKVRRKAAGPRPEKALRQAWERFGPAAGIAHFLPWEPDLTARAMFEGRLLREVAAESSLSKAIRSMACADGQGKANIAVSKATTAR